MRESIKYHTGTEHRQEYEAAVTSLRAVPPDLADRAAAEVLSEIFKRSFLQKHGVKPAGGRTWWGRLIGKRDPYAPGAKLPYLLPGDDHVSLWIKGGKAAVYTSQPYALGFETLCQIVEACKEHGLEVEISADSMYYPGSTLLLTYRRAEGREG